MKSIESLESGKNKRGNAQQNGEIEYIQYQSLKSQLRNEKNKSRMFYCLQCAAEAGHPRAQYELGRELMLQDDAITIAVYWLQKAAVQGVGKAFAELEQLNARWHEYVLTRVEMPKLYTEAAPALLIAANAGDSAAAVEFAVCCEYGYGVAQDKVGAFWLHLQQARHGNTRAMVKLGDCYLNGVGVGRNRSFAVHCYRKAAEHGSTTGWLRFSKCSGVKLCDFNRRSTAFDIIRQTAQFGNANAQYCLAMHYLAGICIKRDEQQAIKLFEEAAQKSDTDAMCALAELSIKNGNIRRAAELFCKAAHAGNARAQSRFGDCYAQGIEVTQDFKLAVKWYRMAAEHLDVQSMRKLANLYVQGTVIKRNIDEACQLLKLAVKTGDPESLVQMAQCLFSIVGTDQAKAGAVRLLQNAANKGNFDAMFKLAECYENGNGVQKNLQQANAIYEELDKFNDPEMKVSMGIMMLQDNNAKQAKKAFELFKQAAKTRNAEGCYLTGLCYYNGAGVAKNINAAAQMYEQATNKGNDDAAIKLAQLYATEQVKPDNPVYAFELYRKTADAAGSDVQFKLAQCYENGIGTAKDIERANEIYASPMQINRSKMHVEAGIKLRQNKDAKSKSDAFQHFLQAAKAKNAERYYQAGQCYESGVGVGSDISTAVEMYKQAITKNHKNAVVALAQLYARKQTFLESSEHLFELYRKTADETEKKMQFKLAECQEYGITTARNPQHAAKLYQKLAESGQAKAWSRLISMYLNELFCDPYSTEAIEVYILGFDIKDANSICQLARCCYENRVSNELVQQIVQKQDFKAMVMLEKAKNCALGFHEPKSDIEAFYMFNHIGSKNDPDVLCAIAQCYRFGWGITRNINKAIGYYLQAVDFGLYEAMNKLRDCKCMLVEKQLEAAFEHFRQSADTGNSNAAFVVAYCYCYAIGVEGNCELACQMYQKAENQNNNNIVVLLGQMYQNGYGIEENEAKAVELFKKAAKTGNREAQYQLGQCYYNAIGAAQDSEQAVFWYEKAASQGHAQAASILGYCYENGNGVEKDMSKAFQYYKQAAIAGDSQGQRFMGYCYKNGEGVEQNCKKAVYWLRKAAAQGHKNVARALNCCLEQLRKTRNVDTDIPQAEPESETTQPGSTNQKHAIAFHLSKLAARLGCSRAYFCLGDCYFNGIGTKRNISAAANCYKRAAPQSSKKFFRLLKCLEIEEVTEGNELNLMSALKRLNTALRGEIGWFNFITQTLAQLPRSSSDQ